MSERSDPRLPTNDEVVACIDVLIRLGQHAKTDPNAPEIVAVQRAFAGLDKAAKRERRIERRMQRAATENELVARSFVFQQQTDSNILSAEIDGRAVGAYERPRRCYVCKELFASIHSVYHLHCPECAAFDLEQRHARSDMRGRRVVLTGGRIKIGFHVALKLLRDGAEVLVTTRFPDDAVSRFKRVDDYGDWGNRLTVVGLDLCDLAGTREFAADVARRWPSIDALVCNAAQTIRRPAQYFAALVEGECQATYRPSLAAGSQPLVAPTLESPAQPRSLDDDSEVSRDIIATTAGTPAVAVDETGEPLDPRAINSWMLRLGQISDREALETYLVGAFAPLMLIDGLLPLLRASTSPDRQVVMVSAMEGQFARETKTSNHPHTNMAKAALNMLVRTSASDLAQESIYMNAVDTGWVTDENPYPRKQHIRERGFHPPLDVVDGAARVYQPIRVGANGEPVWGSFLKNYKPSEW